MYRAHSVDDGLDCHHIEPNNLDSSMHGIEPGSSQDMHLRLSSDSESGNPRPIPSKTTFIYNQPLNVASLLVNSSVRYRGSWFQIISATGPIP